MRKRQPISVADVLLPFIGPIILLGLTICVILGYQTLSNNTQTNMVEYQDEEGKAFGLQYATERCREYKDFADQVCNDLVATVNSDFETRTVEVYHSEETEKFSAVMTILFIDGGSKATVVNYQQYDEPDAQDFRN